jgi:hypothetical protein
MVLALAVACGLIAWCTFRWFEHLARARATLALT